MKVLILTVIAFFMPIVSSAEVMCQDVFRALTPNPVRTEIHIDFGDSDSYKILRKVNRVFNEYPRGYMENTRTTARITVPESRWMEVFAQDYEGVIEELSKVKLYKVEFYADGTQIRTFESDFLLWYGNENIKNFPNEWVSEQRAFSFQFDRRFLTLMERLVEPAYVGMALQSGIIERSNRYDF